jgi:hypothetical protein
MQYNAINHAGLFLVEEQHYGFMIKLTQTAHIGMFYQQHIIPKVESGMIKLISSLSGQKCMKNLHWFNGKFFKLYMNDFNFIMSNIIRFVIYQIYIERLAYL